MMVGRQATGLLLTMALGAAGGGALALTGAPAAWLSGAMLAVAAAALAGLPVSMPSAARTIVFLLLGTSIGDATSPETLALVRTWPLSFVALAVAIAVMTAASTVYLRRVRGWELDTARFSSVPGGLSQVLAMALRAGADLPRIALAQSLRLFVLVAVMPWLLAGSGGGAPAIAKDLMNWGDMGLVLAVACASGLALERLRIPGGAMLGAMLASATLHTTGMVHGRLPVMLVTAGYVATGCLIGSRFTRVPPGTMLATARGGLESVALALVISAALAYAVSQWLGLSFGQVWLAYAPGGVEAMTVLAFLLGADPAFVGAHHVARLIMLNLVVPFWLSRR